VVSFRLSFNNPTLPENTGDHPASYTIRWDTILKGSIKRPDYIVGLPMIGNVSCDVKAKSFYDDKLIFDEYEFRNLANFQRFFNSSVWLVCYPPDDLTTCYMFMNEWLLLEPLQEVRGQNCVYMPAVDMLKIDTEKQTFREALMQATDLA
jgi:hypothetical protein